MNQESQKMRQELSAASFGANLAAMVFFPLFHVHWFICRKPRQGYLACLPTLAAAVLFVVNMNVDSGAVAVATGTVSIIAILWALIDLFVLSFFVFADRRTFLLNEIRQKEAQLIAQLRDRA